MVSIGSTVDGTRLTKMANPNNNQAITPQPLPLGSTPVTTSELNEIRMALSEIVTVMQVSTLVSPSDWASFPPPGFVDEKTGGAIGQSYSIYYGDGTYRPGGGAGNGYPITINTDFQLLYEWTLRIQNAAANFDLSQYPTLPGYANSLFQNPYVEDIFNQNTQKIIDILEAYYTVEEEADIDSEAEAAQEASDNYVEPPVTLDCNDLEQTDEQGPPCPPPCKNDPNASSPNWTNLTEEEPFLNSKTCEYSITLDTIYQGPNKQVLLQQPNYLTVGIEKLLEFYGKKSQPYTNEEGDNVDPVQLCVVGGADIKDIFVSTRAMVNAKALVVIPYDVLNSIEDLEQPENIPSKLNQPLFVVFKGGGGGPIEPTTGFLYISRKAAQAMEIMARRQARWFFNNNGQLSEPTFNLDNEALLVRRFRTELRNFLLQNDYKFRKPVFQGKKWLEEVEIGFSEDMEIEYVKALEKGCDKPEMLLRGFQSFKNKFPMTNKRTMGFVLNIPDIYDAATSSGGIQFSDFIENYVGFPKVSIVTDASGAFAEDPIWCPPEGQPLGFGNRGETPASEINLGEELREISKSIMDEVLSFPDAFADRFADDVCATFEGKRKNDVKLNDLGQLSLQAADAAVRQYFSGDRFISRIPILIEQMSTADPEQIFKEILDSLALCGLFSMLQAAFECLLADIDPNEALQVMLTEAFKAMDQANFEKIFIGLPRDIQSQVFNNLADEFKSIPPPWDSGYRAGNHSGQGIRVQAETNEEAPTGKVHKLTEEEVVNGVPTTVSATTGVVIEESAIGRTYGSPGSIGTALGNITGSILEAYRDALLDLIQNNLIDLNALKDQLMSIPGAQIVADIIEQADCPAPPLFTPPLQNVLTTLELGLCPNHFAITLPKFEGGIYKYIPDIFRLILNVAKELVKEIVVRLIILIVKKIIEILLESLCALLQLTGGALVDAITGGNNLKAALGGALCDEASEDDINNAMYRTLQALNLSDCADLGTAPTVEDAAKFTEIIASILTNNEVLDLVQGVASDQTKRMVSNVVTQQIPNMCMSPSDVENMFKALGTIIDPSIIEQAQFIDDPDAPVCENICASPEQMEIFDSARRAALINKGLTDEEAQQQINNLRERAKEDLADLSRLLQRGPFHEFPDLIGGDPDCPDDGGSWTPGKPILPEVPMEMTKATSESIRRLFDVISERHVRDLVGKRGFLDMVLSDSNGRGLKSHNATVSGPFGQPLAGDLGPSQFYTDNRLDDTPPNTELEGSSVNALRTTATNGIGGFPFTVASLLAHYYTSYNQEFQFDLIAPGAATSDGPETSMRGEVIVGDEKGLRWNAIEGVNFYYRDYIENAQESYAMRMEVFHALRDQDNNWLNDDITTTNIYENIEDSGEELVASYTVRTPISNQVRDLIENIPGANANLPLPAKTFKNLLLSKITQYQGHGNVGVLSTALELQHAYLLDVYMRKFSLLIASNKDKEAQPLPNSFQYGYEIDQQVEAVYLGGPDLDRDFFENNREYYTATTYAEAINPVTGPPAQQVIFDRFGGSYKSPPFYMKNPTRQGWLGLTDRMVPEPDGCDPIDGSEPREPICDFTDLKEIYGQMLNKYKDDPRLFTSPSSTCQAQPFNEVFTGAAAAGVDVTIRATIRIFIIEAMLRGASVFSIYGPDCYDKILADYIIDHISNGIQKVGVFNLPSKKFFYLFMEQIVQMFGRHVDLGMIEPSDEEQIALDYLNDHQSKNQIILRGSNLLSKAKYNERLFPIIEEALEKEASGEWEAGIRTLFNHFVLEELDSTFKQFGDNIYPDGAPIKNLHSIFFGLSPFIRGSVESGIPDVWNGKTGQNSNIYEADFLTADAFPYLSKLNNDSRLDSVGNHPFRLEKYIRIADKPFVNDGSSNSTVSLRAAALKNVVSPEEFKNWIQSLDPSLQSTNMSDYFASVSVGYRLVFASSLSDRGNREWGGSNLAQNFINGFEDAVEPLYNITFQEKTFKVPANTSVYGSTEYTPDHEFMYMIPLASSEAALGLDINMGDFAGNIDSYMLDNRNCLLDNIARTPEYKAMFEIALPFNKMVSWHTIYAVNNFLPSVGWVQDGWVKDGGRWFGAGSGFRSWDQESFEGSKRETRRAFMRFYHSSDPTYEDEESLGARKQVVRAEKPRPNNDPGWRWFRWRRKFAKPTDKNGKLCP